MAWITSFVAGGFWNAIIFLVASWIVGYILGFLFKKVALLATILQYGCGTAAWFIIWNVRGGIWWLIFAIISLLGFLYAVFLIAKFRR